MRSGKCTPSRTRTPANVNLGETTDVVGVDPATIGQVYRFDWEQGSNATLARLGDGAIVDSDYAASNDLKVGSRLQVVTPAGEHHAYTIKGTYKAPKVQPLFTGVLIAQSEFDAAFPRGNNLVSLVVASATGSRGPTPLPPHGAAPGACRGCDGRGS